jgi:hypothetical protein
MASRLARFLRRAFWDYLAFMVFSVFILGYVAALLLLAVPIAMVIDGRSPALLAVMALSTLALTCSDKAYEACDACMRRAMR